MEIEGQDGSKIQLVQKSEVVFGRGKGFNPKDPAVSRRHISFQLAFTGQAAPRVSFEVIGKNPIWVRYKDSGEIRAFRRLERGELSAGDLFCVNYENPVWFSVKNVEDNERPEREIGAKSSKGNRNLGDELEDFSESELIGDEQDLELGFESSNVSNIDPVKEFGFLVIGHEFDNYPKGVIRDVKSWNWFLEDHREDSTDDEDDDYDKGKKALKRKRNKKSERDEGDEEWIGESEDEEVLTRTKKVHAPKYSTRSKDLGSSRPGKGSGTRKGTEKKKSKEEEDDDEEEAEEGDETLGGFIVGDNDDAEEIVEVGEDEEEEEFEEDDSED